MAVVLFVGGAWVVVDRLGTLPAVVAALVRAFAGRGLWMIPIVSLFFATMGALENMQEEIIPLVPALLVLGAGLGIDAVAVVAMSAGAAMVGSAFGPTNPFQAGIALKLAQLPPLSGRWPPPRDVRRRRSSCGPAGRCDTRVARASVLPVERA